MPLNGKKQLYSLIQHRHKFFYNYKGSSAHYLFHFKYSERVNIYVNTPNLSRSIYHKYHETCLHSNYQARKKFRGFYFHC